MGEHPCGGAMVASSTKTSDWGSQKKGQCFLRPIGREGGCWTKGGGGSGRQKVVHWWCMAIFWLLYYFLAYSYFRYCHCWPFDQPLLAFGRGVPVWHFFGVTLGHFSQLISDYEISKIRIFEVQKRMVNVNLHLFKYNPNFSYFDPRKGVIIWAFQKWMNGFGPNPSLGCWRHKRQNWN